MLEKPFHQKHVTWRIMEIIPNNYTPRRPSGCLPTSDMHVEFYHHFGGSLCGHPLVPLCWILRSNNSVGWVVTIFGFTRPRVDAKIHFKSSKNTTSSIQYVVFFGMFNLQKCFPQILSQSEKITSAKGPLSALKKSMGT